MFKHAYHGGPAVEILSILGKNPLEKWKAEGKAVTKVYEKELKGSIFVLG